MYLQREIENFLREDAAADGDDGDDGEWNGEEDDDAEHEDEEFEYDEEGAPGGKSGAAGSGRKRPAAQSVTSRGKAAKSSAGAAPAASPPVDADCSYRLQLSGGSGGNTKYLSVRHFKGRPLVDIREFYTTKEGEQKPGAKGLALNPEQWGKLQDALPELIQSAQQQDHQFEVLLGSNRKAAATEWKGATNVDIREYYDAGGGEMKPGKKGIALSMDAMMLLVEKVEEVNGALGAAGGAAAGGRATTTATAPAAASPSAAAAAVAARSAADTQAGAEAPAAAGKAGVAGGSGGAAPASSGAAAASSYIDLGGSRRVSVSVWKGRTNVDLREYYAKDGNMLPGKKGIAISPADWQLVCGNAAAITAAAEAKDTSYVLKLSGEKRVSMSEFKGKVYVGVREFYQKDGQWLPGLKGLNMNVDQWKTLVGESSTIDAALAAGSP